MSRNFVLVKLDGQMRKSRLIRTLIDANKQNKAPPNNVPAPELMQLDQIERMELLLCEWKRDWKINSGQAVQDPARHLWIH